MDLQNNPVIFIVEDNLFYQNLIARELSISQEVYFFTKGEDCLQNLDKKPSVIVMDYNLDGNLNGLETISQVKAITPDAYIILFSSEKGLNNKENLVKYGSFDFLEKSLQSFDQLKKMVVAAEANHAHH